MHLIGRLVGLGVVVLLAACAGTGGPVTLVVNGKVINSNQQPVASAPVVISYGSNTISTTTDASGAFSVSGVVPPYDATVIRLTQALVYKGLIRSDPTLLFLSVSIGTVKSAALKGSVTGGAGSLSRSTTKPWWLLVCLRQRILPPPPPPPGPTT